MPQSDSGQCAPFTLGWTLITPDPAVWVPICFGLIRTQLYSRLPATLSGLTQGQGASLTNPGLSTSPTPVSAPAPAPRPSTPCTRRDWRRAGAGDDGTTARHRDILT